MTQALLGGLIEYARIPPSGELLDRRDVDRTVVQELLDLARIAGEKATVGADRVATQRHGPCLGDVLLQEGHGFRNGVFEADGRGLDLGQQA